MRGLRGIAGIERAQHDRIALIHQRVEQRDILSGALHLAGLCEIAETPRGVALLGNGYTFFLRRRNDHGRGTRRKLGVQLGEVARHAELPTMLVHHAEIHQQVRRQLFEAERLQRHVNLLLFADVARQRLQQRRVRGGHFTAERCGEFRHRHQVAAQFLLQCLDQLRDLLRQDARNQPLATGSGHLIDQRKRHGQRDAIVVLARREVVAQHKADVVYLQIRRELVGGDARRLVAHQVVFFQVEQFRVGTLRLLAPRFEGRAIVDVMPGELTGDAAVVERKDQFVVHQHIGAARLVLQRFDVGDQFPVVREERRARLELAADQCLAYEYLARFRRIHRPVMHALLGVEQQAMQSAAFIGHDLRGLLLPMRLVIMPLDQVRAGFLQPPRLDARHVARI